MFEGSAGVAGAARNDMIERRIVLALSVGVPLVIAAAYLWRMFSGIDPAERFLDDFFYYMTAAQNWVDGAGSTFFPGEETNGYHPLWFLWLALLYRVTGSAGEAFFGLVDLSLMALLIGFFFLFERFLRAVVRDRLASAAGAAFASLKLALLGAAGMEMALACLLIACLLERLSRKPLADQRLRDAALAGFLGALVVLSRLDAIWLAPGLAVVAIMRWDAKRLAAAAVGAAPLYGYVAFNLSVHGHAFTTSMAAKSMGFYLPPNFYFLASQKAAAFEVSVAVASILAFMLLRRCDNADGRRIAIALITAPILQFAVQALMSGWLLFEWYFYFGVMAMGLAIALAVGMFQQRAALRRMGLPLGLAAVAIVPFWVADGLRPNAWQVEMAEIARQLDDFEETHPGVYAMGDAAGTPGWMMEQPLVHLEGLMMSHGFLERIRNQRPLEEVFRDYRVDYFIAVRPEEVGPDGCFNFAEPNAVQASTRTPKMRMTICDPPVATIDPGDRYFVRIYRIDPETGQVKAP